MGLVSKAGKEIGHGFLGLFPEQEWFSNHISWYDSNKGIRSSTSMEALFGAGYLSLMAILGTDTKFTDSQLMGGLGGYSLGDGFMRMFGYKITSIKCGTMILDFPWAMGKDTYQWFRDLPWTRDRMLKRK